MRQHHCLIWDARVGVGREGQSREPAEGHLKDICLGSPEPCLTEPMGLEFLCAASPLGNREQLFLMQRVDAPLLAP